MKVSAAALYTVLSVVLIRFILNPDLYTMCPLLAALGLVAWLLELERREEVKQVELLNDVAELKQKMDAIGVLTSMRKMM